MVDFLDMLKNNLSNEWNPRLHPAQGADGFPRLVQELGPMQFTIVQLSAVQRAVGSVSEREDIDRLQMYVRLPFNVNEHYMADVTRLLNHLNGQLPLLGFIISADKNTVAFRYLHLFDPKNPGYALIEEAMTQIKFAVASFTQVIHTVSRGAASYEQVVHELDRHN